MCMIVLMIVEGERGTDSCDFVGYRFQLHERNGKKIETQNRKRASY